MMTTATKTMTTMTTTTNTMTTTTTMTTMMLMMMMEPSCTVAQLTARNRRNKFQRISNRKDCLQQARYRIRASIVENLGVLRGNREGTASIPVHIYTMLASCAIK